MAEKQGKEKAPQIKRRLWLGLGRLAYAIQLGVAVGTKLTESLGFAKVGEPIPQESAGTAFIKVANLAMNSACDEAGKDYAKHSVILKVDATDAEERKAQTPRTVGAKLNTLRNWYLRRFVHLEDGVAADVPRDAFGNVQRSKLLGDDKKIRPEFNGHYSQAQWPEFDGVPEVSGRSTDDDDLTDDDDYDF